MTKTPLGINVLEAAKARIAWTFDHFPRVYLSFSGGKDSTVMLHLVADEAQRRNRKFGLFFVDLEAQYTHTIEHVEACYRLYKKHIEPYWCAIPIRLRNAVSMYEPYWVCWSLEQRSAWVREYHSMALTDCAKLPFCEPSMEFEEFVPQFGEWYSQGKQCACFVGIRANESLNRFRTIANQNKRMIGGKRWTTGITEHTYNVYPLYDWKTEDIWAYHGQNPDRPYNKLYDLMHMAGLTIHQARICQPYGDDQRRGLWLIHLIEPETWGRIVARVNGANSGSMYIQESGNITGYRRISKPEGHTWRSFATTLLETLPDKTREHFANKVAIFQKWWIERGYPDGIPDEAPYELETKREVPSWRRVCKALLRNDYWCKGIGFSQTKSDAYGHYLDLMRRRRDTWEQVPLFNDDLGRSLVALEKGLTQ